MARPQGNVSNAAMQDRRAMANVRPVASVARNAAVADRRSVSAANNATPSAPAAPAAPTTQSFSQQIDYGQATPAIATPVQPDTSVETLEKTPEFLARERELINMLDQFKADQALKRTRFDTDLSESFRDLGFDPTSRNFDLGELMAQGQRETASGRAYNALRNDFAARGMLQSGAYQARRGTLTQQLMDQANELEGRTGTFAEDQAIALRGQEDQFRNQRNLALEEAKQAILGRMGMGG